MKREIIVGVENARVQFRMEIEGAAPDLVKGPDGTLFMLVGRYASPGDRYCYKAVLVTEFNGEVRAWPEYSPLKG